MTSNELTLNSKLLGIICTVQAAKKLFIQEDLLNELAPSVVTPNRSDKSDWMNRTREFFHGMDTEFVNSVGLKKNELCFRSIINFELTENILNTPSSELHKYSFYITP